MPTFDDAIRQLLYSMADDHANRDAVAVVLQKIIDIDAKLDWLLAKTCSR